MKANELKVTDLMVGNWVICYHPSRLKSFEKVSVGLLHTMQEQEYGHIKENSPLFRIVEPIPLTPEILEKNGFTLENKVKSPARYIYYISHNNAVLVDFDCYNNGRRTMKCMLVGVGHISDSYTRIYSADIYIHQLQHALKLCGIEKEIVL